MSVSARLGILGLSLVMIGCGGGADALKVTGTVYLDEKPLPDAVVTFHPAEGTKGLGGGGRTGPDGKYTLVPGREKIEPGQYRVVISRPLRPDGTPPDPQTPPIESDAKETLPAHYSSLDKTKLTAEVATDKTVHDFKLKK